MAAVSLGIGLWIAELRLDLGGRSSESAERSLEYRLAPGSDGFEVLLVAPELEHLVVPALRNRELAKARLDWTDDALAIAAETRAADELAPDDARMTYRVKTLAKR